MNMAVHTCESPDCGKEAKLNCPTCLKLGLQSYFCDQTCFKKNFAEHKAKHKSPKPATYNPFPNYPFTGPLRPVYPLSPRRPVPTHIQRPDYAETGVPLSERNLRSSTQIEVLKPEEIEKMRTVCKLTREVLDEGAKALKIGVTSDEIDRVIHNACIERNCYPSPLNYNRFPKSCCTSPNEVICHGIPDQREIQDGDIFNIDVSVYHDGFHGDMNETYCIGNVDEAGRKLVDSARECLENAIAFVKPGQWYRDVGKVIQTTASRNKHSVVRSYCGHGIHRLFHCTPSVPHYSKNKAVGVMKPGHVFTIEPMICEGTWQDHTWPDDWTAVTVDGKRSAQFEHTLLVTESGCEVLTR